MAVVLGLARQTLRERAHRGFAIPEAIDVSPIKHRADPLAYAAGRFGLAQPDRQQRLADLRAFDVIDEAVADEGIGVGFERRDPLDLMLAVLPAGLVFRVDLFGGDPKGRNDDLLFLLFRDRIDALGDQAAILAGLGARFGKGEHLGRAQANITTAALDTDPEDPALRSARRDIEDQAIAINVPTRRSEVLDLGGSELAHVRIPCRFAHHFSHQRWWEKVDECG